MKKYILIQNDGEIESNSFELIGASTKRGETGKIGFFGSGLKYSIAYMMRTGIEFKVFSGQKELVFTTTPETLKDQTFDRICINGKPTSYTVTMGPTWKEDWFVLREIYCNALDESNCQLIRETENVNFMEGKTRIYIELTDKLREVVNNWDAYFCAERTPLFKQDNVYTCYIGSDDINPKNTQSVTVYNKTSGAIFRKGIKVGELTDYLFDYSMDSVSINEDRTAKHLASMSYVVTNLMSAFPSEHYVATILRSGTTDKCLSEYLRLKSPDSHDPFSEKWVSFSKEYLLVVEEKSGKFVDEISKTTKEVLFIPRQFARLMKEKLPDVQILGIGKTIADTSFTEVEMTNKMSFLLKEVLRSLKEMKYDVPFEITPVQFDNDEVLGKADTKAKHIYLADKTFDMGRREIAMTLMEETEHILSGKEDETRAFQTHLFSQWLKTMENANGLFL